MHLVSQFTEQFLPEMKPSPATIEKTWKRLLNENQRKTLESSQPKGLTMATLYMLHIERFRPHEKPHVDAESGQVVRRERLKAFGNWVPCRCRSSCRVEWNFANDKGLHREDGESRCNMVGVFKERGISLYASISIKSDFESMKSAWMNGRTHKVARKA